MAFPWRGDFQAGSASQAPPLYSQVHDPVPQFLDASENTHHSPGYRSGH